MKKVLFVIASITFGLCACNKVEVPSTDTPEAPVVVYHMNIPASIDGQTKGVTFDVDGIHISTQFETTDKIYVYNETKDAFARDASDSYNLKALSPSAISGSKTSCTLTGDLTFFDDNKDAVTVEVGDTYSLFYQMNDPNDYDNHMFVYDLQDGSSSSASDYDFAMVQNVAMTLEGEVLSVPEGVAFSNLQSMFRQSLSFTGEYSNPVTPLVFTNLIISTRNKTLIPYFYFSDYYNSFIYNREIFSIEDPVITDGNVFLSLKFMYDGEYPRAEDKFVLYVRDNEGNTYRGIKNAPSSGFDMSKYYHGNMALSWLTKYTKPAVTRNDGGDDDEVNDPIDWGLDDYLFDIYDGSSTTEITIDGNSTDFRFWLNVKNGTVRLKGNGTAYYFEKNPFIVCDDGLTIVLESDYSIICPNNKQAICTDSGNLKLATNGGEKHLTVTVNSMDYAGLYGDDNYDKGRSGNVSALAADGFAVTCSSPIDNGDGTYTWTYTVSPVPAYYSVADTDLGKVIGADGEIYSNVDAATAAGTTAEAMIAYVGSIPYVCSHGLAISLTDVYEYQTSYADALSQRIPSWATAHPVLGGTWRLPSEKEWQYMLWGYYVANPAATDISGFNTKLTTAGGTALPTDSYFWTSTEKDIDEAKTVYQDNVHEADVFDTNKTENWHVRACLSF